MAGLDDLFAQLRELLARHAALLVIARDEPGDLQLEAKQRGPSGTGMPFGAVTTRERDVRVQVMALVSHPDLLADISDPLRERMRGKGCFDLTPDDVTEELHGELSALVDAGLERYRADGLA